MNLTEERLGHILDALAERAETGDDLLAGIRGRARHRRVAAASGAAAAVLAAMVSGAVLVSSLPGQQSAQPTATLALSASAAPTISYVHGSSGPVTIVSPMTYHGSTGSTEWTLKSTRATGNSIHWTFTADPASSEDGVLVCGGGQGDQVRFRGWAADVCAAGVADGFDFVGSAVSPEVAYLVVSQWSGQRVRIEPLPVNAHGVRVWAFAYPDVDYVKEVTAYDKANKRLPDPPGGAGLAMTPDCSNHDDVPLYLPYCPTPYPSPIAPG